MSENLISIQQYAIKHKLSTFATVKLINQGKIKTIKKVLNGEEREFVMDDTAPQTSPTSTQTSNPVTHNTTDYEKEYHLLLIKYSALQEKYSALLEEMKHAQK